MKVTAPIYIMFDNGKCAKALDFYKKVFKATDGFSWKMTMGESPLKDQVSDKAKDHIMHMSLKLADDTELMAMDYNPKFHKRQIGVNTAIMLKPDTKEEADRLFKDLSSNGGSVEDEMAIQVSLFLSQSRQQSNVLMHHNMTVLTFALYYLLLLFYTCISYGAPTLVLSQTRLESNG
jgi:PhnB protein